MCCLGCIDRRKSAFALYGFLHCDIRGKGSHIPDPDNLPTLLNASMESSLLTLVSGIEEKLLWLGALSESCRAEHSLGLVNSTGVVPDFLRVCCAVILVWQSYDEEIGVGERAWASLVSPEMGFAAGLLSNSWRAHGICFAFPTVCQCRCNAQWDAFP